MGHDGQRGAVRHARCQAIGAGPHDTRPTGLLGVLWETRQLVPQICRYQRVTNFYCRSHRNVQVRCSYLVYRLESFDVDRDCEVV
jgi:hypothetical protein